MAPWGMALALAAGTGGARSCDLPGWRALVYLGEGSSSSDMQRILVVVLAAATISMLGGTGTVLVLG